MSKTRTKVETKITVLIELSEEEAKLLYRLVIVPATDFRNLMSNHPVNSTEDQLKAIPDLILSIRAGLRRELDYIDRGLESGDWS